MIRTNLPSVKPLELDPTKPVYVGIVGHAVDKFTPQTKELAFQIIHNLLLPSNVILVSGHCHLGGIDIWAEYIARTLHREMVIFPPKDRSWSTGYKPRNLLIANRSDIVHCIVVKEYPPNYSGMKFSHCYHCGTSDHVKSGGCWTALRCKKREWHKV